MIIGVISDTHGLIRDQALKALQEAMSYFMQVTWSSQVIKTLEEIAPVYAVRGNTDRGIWADPVHDTNGGHGQEDLLCDT